MNVMALTEQINRLTEKKEYQSARLLADRYSHYSIYPRFNDAYATLLYCTNQFTEARKVLRFNLKILKQYPTNTPTILCSYFLKALCYLAENNTEKAHAYIQKCMKLSTDQTNLQQEFQQLLQSDQSFTQKNS